jgi:hypothetical protein
MKLLSKMTSAFLVLSFSSAFAATEGAFISSKTGKKLVVVCHNQDIEKCHNFSFKYLDKDGQLIKHFPNVCNRAEIQGRFEAPRVYSNAMNPFEQIADDAEDFKAGAETREDRSKFGDAVADVGVRVSAAAEIILTAAFSPVILAVDAVDGEPNSFQVKKAAKKYLAVIDGGEATVSAKNFSFMVGLLGARNYYCPMVSDSNYIQYEY